MTAPFASLPPRTTAVDACVRSLRESILTGAVTAGSRLPPERELAVSLGVNRLTLRSALAQLVAAGLVSVRHGSGYVVRELHEAGGPDLLAAFLEVATDPATRREGIADLLLVRRALARAMLERLLETVDAKGLARVKEAVERFAEVALAPDATPETIAHADHATIRAIVREAKSTVLSLATNPVLRVADAIPELTRALFREPAMNVAAYRGLVDALASRDTAALDAVLNAMALADASVVEALGGPKRAKKPGSKPRRSKS